MTTFQPFQSDDPAPVIDSITPAQGVLAGGDLVTIAGDRFRGGDPALEVLFDGVPAPVASVVSSSVAAVGSNGKPGRATRITPR